MSIFGSASGSDVSGIESSLESLVPQFSDYASQAAALSPGFEQQGQDIYGTAFPQFQAGAAGQVTPAQQAAIDQTKQQELLQNAGTYGNLGLGGSTMQTQDANAIGQKSLAQSQAFSSLDETLGLSGLYQGALPFENLGLGALTGAGSILGGATTALGSAGSLAAGEQQTQLGLLGGLGSALGGSQGLFGSSGLLGGLFGGGGAAAADTSSSILADTLAVGGAGAIF